VQLLCYQTAIGIQHFVQQRLELADRRGDDDLLLIKEAA
jgi:hypothetical protein